ncbi:pentapeptide repeat-containing protein [Frankia sp. ACN1ag]|uniref:pentapeptide repeat-containing protein n=1 Tax=Frankia sp. ACN1ag TaxID=102891 RepID=UPI00128EE2A5
MRNTGLAVATLGPASAAARPASATGADLTGADLRGASLTEVSAQRPTLHQRKAGTSRRGRAGPSVENARPRLGITVIGGPLLKPTRSAHPS